MLTLTATPARASPGVEMEGMELGDFTVLDARQTWAECRQLCSRRWNCIGVVFKDGRTRGHQGCQEYSSLRKLKQPEYSGPSTACIKIKV